MSDEPARPVLTPEQAELLAAVETGNLDKVRQLVGQDMTLANTRSPDGQSAVQLAAERVSWERPKHLQIAQYLVAQGAECDIFTAARAGLLEHVRELLRGRPLLLDAEDGLGRTALQRAALAGAGCRECDAAADFLIERGAKVDIFTACAFGMLDEVSRWVAQNRRLVHARSHGGTPLLWAVRPRRNAANALSICRLLLESRADVNAEDAGEGHRTVLHHAAEWGNSAELVQLLVDRGAEVNACDDAGWTPLDHANERRRPEIAAFLRSRGAKEASAQAAGKFGAQAREMIGAAQRGDVTAVTALLAENPGLAGARGTCGETPLHWAAHNGHVVVAELLLTHGADVHAEAAAKWGGTPLAWAAEKHLELVTLLCARGAPVTAVNTLTGQTPLHCCARAGGDAEIAVFLVAHGADINARDNTGRTALQYAYQYDNTGVVAVLRRHKAKEL